MKYVWRNCWCFKLSAFWRSRWNGTLPSWAVRWPRNIAPPSAQKRSLSSSGSCAWPTAHRGSSSPKSSPTRPPRTGSSAISATPRRSTWACLRWTSASSTSSHWPWRYSCTPASPWSSAGPPWSLTRAPTGAASVRRARRRCVSRSIRGMVRTGGNMIKWRRACRRPRRDRCWRRMTRSWDRFRMEDALRRRCGRADRAGQAGRREEWPVSVIREYRCVLYVQVVCLTFERLWNLARETFAPVLSLNKLFTSKNLVEKSSQKIRFKNIQNRRSHGSLINHLLLWFLHTRNVLSMNVSGHLLLSRILCYLNITNPINFLRNADES